MLTGAKTPGDKKTDFKAQSPRQKGKHGGTLAGKKEEYSRKKQTLLKSGGRQFNRPNRRGKEPKTGHSTNEIVASGTGTKNSRKDWSELTGEWKGPKLEKKSKLK